MWFIAKIKGNGAKPLTARCYIEADSDTEAKERAERIGLEEYSLFGIRSVELFETEYTSSSEIQKQVSNASSPNEGYKIDGTKIRR